jgi:hypothetical protein
MKPNSILIGVAAVLAACVAGCGGTGTTTPPAVPASVMPQSKSQSLDTAQVLTQARETSETADPYRVDDGALQLTDTSDSADPIVVNAI